MGTEMLVAPRGEGPAKQPRVALALGGGGARGLANIGVLQALELEGIAPGFIAGSGTGGLIGALHASGLHSGDLVEIARKFRFPRWFLPGGLLGWEQIFPSAAKALPGTFEALSTPLALTATDIEEGCQIVLHSGDLLPAVRATCAIPGVLPPERIGSRWLVDGAVVNILPVDAAWTADPDVVIAVHVGGPRTRLMPELAWSATGILSRLGRIVPNPATAKVSFEILTRAAEILLERQSTLYAAITDPEVLIAPELGDMGLRDFDRLDHAIAAGRSAMEAALPGLEALLAFPQRRPVHSRNRRKVDPVCKLELHPIGAPATVLHRGVRHYFCSVSCRDTFLRFPAQYPHSMWPEYESIRLG